MNPVLSIDEYYTKDNPQLSLLREALSTLEISDKEFKINSELSLLSENSSDRELAHESFVLDYFDDISKMNISENYLCIHGYNVVSLVESGIYQYTIPTIEMINENFLKGIKKAFYAMTEDGSAIGMFQFLLDIIGLIPSSLIGIPVDIAANLLNAIIYFIRDKFLLGILNLIAMVDITKAFSWIKKAIKPLTKHFSTFFKYLMKPGGGKLGAKFLKNNAEVMAKPKLVHGIGQAIRKVGNWLANTGVNLLKSIVPNLTKAINKITFGAFKLDKYIPKMIQMFDGWSVKFSKFSKEALDASTELLSTKTAKAADKTLTKSVNKVGKAAKDTAEIEAAAVGKKLSKKTATKIEKKARLDIVKDLGIKNRSTISKYNTEVLGRATKKFNKVFPNGASSAIKNKYIYQEATKELMENVLSKKVGLLSITNNKALMKALSSGKTWRGAEKMLSKAIKSGSSESLEYIMKKMLKDPELFALISKNSPEIAKTMSIFAQNPKVLINGSKTFAEFGVKFGAKIGKRTIAGRVLTKLPVFILKLLMKDSPCLSKMTNVNNIDDVKRITSNKITTAAITEQSSPDIIEISKESLDQLKQTDPNAYNTIVQSNKEMTDLVNQVKTQTDSTSICADTIAIKSAVAGAIIDSNIQYYGKNSIYKHGYKGSIDMKSEEDHTGLNNLTKGYLSALGLDSDINPQHPLGDDPVVKAYFSPVVNTHGKIEPVESDSDIEAAVDRTLDEMIKAGQLKEVKRKEFKKMIMNSYKTDTIPPQVIQAIEGDPNLNEGLFKVGKLIVKR